MIDLQCILYDSFNLAAILKFSVAILIKGKWLTIKPCQERLRNKSYNVCIRKCSILVTTRPTNWLMQLFVIPRILEYK